MNQGYEIKPGDKVRIVRDPYTKEIHHMSIEDEDGVLWWLPEQSAPKQELCPETQS